MDLSIGISGNNFIWVLVMFLCLYIRLFYPYGMHVHKHLNGSQLQMYKKEIILRKVVVKPKLYFIIRFYTSFKLGYIRFNMLLGLAKYP